MPMQRLMLASTVQQLKVESDQKAAAAGVSVNLDNLLATYQKKVEKGHSLMQIRQLQSLHTKNLLPQMKTLAWL